MSDDLKQHQILAAESPEVQAMIKNYQDITEDLRQQLKDMTDRYNCTYAVLDVTTEGRLVALGNVEHLEKDIKNLELAHESTILELENAKAMIRKAVTKNVSLTQENYALRQDALRYQFFRANAEQLKSGPFYDHKGENPHYEYHWEISIRMPGDTFDKAIDAEIAEIEETTKAELGKV